MEDREANQPGAEVFSVGEPRRATELSAKGGVVKGNVVKNSSNSGGAEMIEKTVADCRGGQDHVEEVMIADTVFGDAGELQESLLFQWFEGLEVPQIDLTATLGDAIELF